MGSIKDGILQLINRRNIEKLVIGDASDGSYHLALEAPGYCCCCTHQLSYYKSVYGLLVGFHPLFDNDLSIDRRLFMRFLRSNLPEIPISGNLDTESQLDFHPKLGFPSSK